MTFSEVYNLLNGFFHLFVINYYHDKTIYSIKNSLSLLQLLIKYHAPDLFNFFEKSMLFPEVYATSWILTVFAYKLNLNKLFYLWNKLILDNDQLMMHYFFAALLIYKKNSFINLDEYSLPLALTRLNIGSEKEIDIIYNNALNLRKQTPYSFRHFAYKLDILKHKSNNHKIKYDFYHPDILVSIPIFPSEICFICYNNIIKCPDENHISLKTFNCEHCSMGIKKEINYILLDVRLNDSNNSKNGVLQNINILDQKELKDENILNILKDKFSQNKDKNHFIFINSKTGNLIDQESNFNTSNLKPKKSKTTKNEDIENIPKKKKLSQKEKNIEKEEKILKKITKFLIQNNYKYISYAYGGFEAIHNEIMDKKNKIYSKIKILNHIEERCEICKNTTIYTMEGKELLQEEGNAYLEDIMPTLYNIVQKVKEFQNLKNRIELLDIQTYTELVNDIMARMVSWLRLLL